MDDILNVVAWMTVLIFCKGGCEELQKQILL